MKSSGFQKLLVFGSLVLLLTACSMEASIQSLIDDIKILKAPGQVLGISSGSTQAVSPTNSTNKFVVSAAVGFTGGSNYSASPSLVHTTANGMKVYSAVQGAIVAE